MADTRDRIITATNELYRRQGYNATSLSQISEASQATIGSIYHFFPGGKEALGVCVIETTGSIYRELFESFAQGAADPVSAYVDFFAGAAAVLEDSDYLDPCPIGTVAREIANTSEPLRTAAEQVFNSWIDASTQLLSEAGIADDRAKALSETFVAMVEGAFVLSRTLRCTEPLLSIGQVCAGLVTSALAEQVASERA